jgi:hypothetical protein
MKLKVIFPWILILGLSAGLGAMYVKSAAKDTELTQLREQSKEIEQLRADAAAAQEKAQLSEDQVVVSRKDKEELIRLRGEVGKLRLENQKFTKDMAALQNRADAARSQAESAVQQAAAVKAQMTATMNQSNTAAAGTQRTSCMNNLQLLQIAKQQWAAENGKTADAIPTAEDLVSYLRNNAIPVCPAGGGYTANSVGQLPTCSAPGHVLQ